MIMVCMWYIVQFSYDHGLYVVYGGRGPYLAGYLIANCIVRNEIIKANNDNEISIWLWK